MSTEPQFFKTPTAFRAWLQKNHNKATELHVGFFKKGTGKPSITWPESVAEALCFGWIDGIRRSLDDERYTIRFTPRRKSSKWSAINIRLVAELEAAGKMADAGRAAFDARPHKTGPKSKGYSYVKLDGSLDEASVRRFRRNKAAWDFFEAQPPSYRGKISWWVMSARQDETKRRRLTKLMAASAGSKRLM